MPASKHRTESASPRRGGALFFVLLAAVVGLALFLRAWNLDGPSLWEDEFLTLDRAFMDPARMFQVQKFQGPADTIFDLQPPLIYGVLHGVLALSETSLAARALSAASGILTVFGFFLLGSITAGRRTGLLAACLCALSLNHVEASRSIKHYALFICLSLYVLYFCLAYLRSASNRALAAFTACSAGMVYCGYQGIPLLAAILAGTAWTMLGHQDRPEARARAGWKLTAAVMLVGAAYLPYVQAPFFLSNFLHDPATNPLKTLTPSFFINIFEGFISHIYKPTGWQTALVAVFCLAGTLSLFRERNKAVLKFLACWSVLPAIPLLGSHSGIQSLLTSRHFAFLLIPGVLTAARGLDVIGEWILSRVWPTGAGRFASVGLGLAACLGLAALNLDSYEEQLHRDIGVSRDLLHWISRDSHGGDSVRYLGYKRNSMRFAERWYLGGQFLPPGTWEAPSYRREYLVENRPAGPGGDEPELPGVLLRRYGTGVLRTRVSEAGFANRSPLVMLPGPGGRYVYQDDFKSYAYLEDCFQSLNFSPDTELGLLRPDRYSRPAHAVYVFQVSPGAAASSVTASITAQAFKRLQSVPFDSSLEVLASPDGHEYVSLGRVGQDDFAPERGGILDENCGFFEEIKFYNHCLRVKKQWDVSRFVGNSGKLFLKIAYSPGVVEGFLNVAGIGLSADVEDAGTAQARALQAENLLRNIRAVAWRPGETSASGVYAFAAPDFEADATPVEGLSPSGSLPEFLEQRPGIKPVYVLRDGHGRGLVTVYDTLLGTSGMALSARTPVQRIRLPRGESLDARGLVLTGKISAPVLEISGQTVDIPVVAPSGSVLTLNPGGQGRITYSPDFAEGFDGRDTFDEENLAKARHPDYQGGITCKPGTTCHLTYLFLSAFPITELRIRTYPRLYGLPGDPGRSRLSYSADGGPFVTVDEREAARSEDWTPMHTRRNQTVRFEKPVRQILLRLDLQSNENAEFWSHTRPVDAMCIEADLSGVWLEPIKAQGPEVSLKLLNSSGNDFQLRFSRAPLTVRDLPRANFFKN